TDPRVGGRDDLRNRMTTGAADHAVRAGWVAPEAVEHGGNKLLEQVVALVTGTRSTHNRDRLCLRIVLATDVDIGYRPCRGVVLPVALRERAATGWRRVRADVTAANR